MSHEEEHRRVRPEDGMSLDDAGVRAPLNRAPDPGMSLADLEVEASLERTNPDALDEKEYERLTPRETEVLGLVARGQTNPQIARRLVVSTGTVRVHVQHIVAKLKVPDRTAAATRAVRLGWISPPDGER